jgi:hypothetical protein
VLPIKQPAAQRALQQVEPFKRVVQRRLGPAQPGL